MSEGVNLVGEVAEAGIPNLVFVTGEMVRFSRRVDTKTDFIKYTVQMITKMIKHKYSKKRLLTKVRAFRHWPKKLGRWSYTRQRILQLLDDIWHTHATTIET